MTYSENHLKTSLNPIKTMAMMVFALTILTASGMAATGPSITVNMSVKAPAGYLGDIPSMNGTVINATNVKFNISFNVSVVPGSENISLINISAPSGITFNTVAVSGWNCSLTSIVINCTSDTDIINGTNGVSVFYVNLTASTANTYVFYINVSSSGQKTANLSTTYLYVDTTRPTYRVAVNGTNGLNISAGEPVVVIVNFTSGIAPLKNVTVNVTFQGVSYPCYGNSTVSAVVANATVAGNCTFTATNLSGTYTVTTTVQDYATLANNTAAGSYAAYFTAWNAQPMLTYPAADVTIVGQLYSMNISNQTLVQKRPKYDLMVPVYGGQQNLSLKGATGTGGEWINPTYYDNSTVINSNTMEDLAYNYSFMLNFTANSSLPQILNFSISAPGLVPTTITTMSVYSPDGTTKTMNMMMPDFQTGNFTIYWEGKANSSTGAISPAHPIAGTYNMYTGAINLSVNTTVINGSNIRVWIPMSTMPLLNITSQTITGWSPSSPPTIGSSVNAIFYINVSGNNQYYSPSNMTTTFMFPHNITFYGQASVNTTTTTSTEVLLWRLNSTNNVWYLIANSSDLTYHNTSMVSAISDVLNLSSLPNTPMTGQNVTVNLWGFRYNLSEGRTLGWTYGSNVELKATTQLTFNYSKSMTGTAAPGSEVIYNATINSGVQGGIIIPDTELPGYTPNASILGINLNGQALTEGVQYARGSIIINGTSVQQGSNTFSVTYTVPIATPPSTGTGAGGGGAPAAATGRQAISLAIVSADTPTTATFTNKLLSVTAIDVTLSADANDVTFTAENLAAKPESVASPTGTAFKYMTITSNILSVNIDGAKIKFKVNASWYAANNLDPATTKLMRYTTSWETLTTTQVSSDSDYYYFEAQTPGFSTFAITALEKTTPAPTTCSTTCPGQSQYAYPNCSCYTPATEETGQPEQQIIQGIPNYSLLAYMIIGTLVIVFVAYWALKKAKIIKL